MPYYPQIVPSLVPGGNPVYNRCRLDYVSTVIVRLSRCDGKLLTIDDRPCDIPVAGVDLAPTGLVVSTLYYVYAAMVGGVMVLEPSATVHVADPRNGIRVKTGDASRTLVGMVYPAAGPVWVGLPDASRKVSSYYNRKQFRSTVGIALSTGTAAAYVNTSGPCEFLVWANDAVQLVNLCYYACAAQSSAYNQIMLDTGNAYSVLEGAYANNYTNLAMSAMHVFAIEGWHSATAQGWQSVGGGAWTGNMYALVWA